MNDWPNEDDIIDLQDPSRQEEDMNLPIELTNDLLEYASKKKNAMEYEKLVVKFMKISPEYRFKVFYNIAIKINELKYKDLTKV